MANNKCDCPNPPGGTVVCEPHQMAVCYVIDGIAIQRCLDPIDSKNPVELVNWAIGEIKQEEIYRKNDISGSDIEMLTHGIMESGNKKISFSIPTRIENSIIEILKRFDDDDDLEID